jgi:hypothetical protein
MLQVSLLMSCSPYQMGIIWSQVRRQKLLCAEVNTHHNVLHLLQAQVPGKAVK